MKCNTDSYVVAERGLNRIKQRVLSVERATGRKYTPGRAAGIVQDDLSVWNARECELALGITVDLRSIAAAASAYCQIALEEWTA